MEAVDWVKREPVKCPGCGRELKKFQSEDGFRRRLIIAPGQLLADARRMWGNEIRAEYYADCLDGCGGRLTFTYNPEGKRWSQKFKTEEELYGNNLTK